MTNLARFSRPLSALVLVLSALGLAGCGSDAATAGADGRSGGVGTGGAAAAGGGGGAGAFGPGGSGGGSTGPSSLTLKTVDAVSGAALAGVRVIVSRADGSLDSTAISDAGGTVDLLVPEAGFVSVLWNHDERTAAQIPALRKVAEVRSFFPPPGLEALEVHLQPSEPAPAPPMRVSFDLPPLEGIQGYGIQLSCGVSRTIAADAGTARVDEYTGCPGAETFDAMLVGYRDEGAAALGVQPITYAVRQGIPFAPGTEVSLRFDFDAKGAALHDVRFRSSGGFGDAMSFELASLGAGRSGLRLADGYHREPAEADAATTLRAAPGYASSYCYSIRWNDDGPDGDEGEARSGCSDELPELVDFDGGRLAIPSIDARPGSAQFSLSPGEPGDGLELQAQRDSADGARRWRWSALRDPEVFGTFAFPQLPAEQASFGFGGAFDPGDAPEVRMTLSNIDLVDLAHGFVVAMAAVPFGEASSRHQVELAYSAKPVE